MNHIKEYGMMSSVVTYQEFISTYVANLYDVMCNMK